MKPAPKGAGGLLSQDLQLRGNCYRLKEAAGEPGSSRIKYLKYSLLPAVLLLSACSQPIVRVQYVTVKSYLPIPATLTAPIAVDLTGMTYGEGLGSLRAGLETCNGQLTSIATLKPPPTL